MPESATPPPGEGKDAASTTTATGQSGTTQGSQTAPGATEQANGRHPRLPKQTAIVTELKNKLAEGPAPHEDLALAGLITVSGFNVGEMTKGRCRLYLTYRMDEFVEFNDDDVLTHQVMSAAQFPPLGGVIMWLRREANVVYTRISSRQVQADLLSGAIAQARQGAGGDGGSSGDVGGYIGGYVGGYVGGNVGQDPPPTIHPLDSVVTKSPTC